MLTNLLKLACIATLLAGAVGCGDDTGSTTTQDLSMSLPGDMANTGAGDMAKSSSDAGSSLLALCATCTKDSECASGACLIYGMGQNPTKKCSHTCSNATASTDCPGINACTNKNTCLCP